MDHNHITENERVNGRTFLKGVDGVQVLFDQERRQRVEDGEPEEPPGDWSLCPKAECLPQTVCRTRGVCLGVVCWGVVCWSV